MVIILSISIKESILNTILMQSLNIVFDYRFCSRPFTLTCGHESIHLCNNAVQARYTNAERSSKLPVDNMWDNKTFIQFLKEQGHGDKWHTLIYPTMKKCLISKCNNSVKLRLKIGANKQLSLPSASLQKNNIFKIFW